MENHLDSPKQNISNPVTSPTPGTKTPQSRITKIKAQSPPPFSLDHDDGATEKNSNEQDDGSKQTNPVGGDV